MLAQKEHDQDKICGVGIRSAGVHVTSAVPWPPYIRMLSRSIAPSASNPVPLWLMVPPHRPSLVALWPLSRTELDSGPTSIRCFILVMILWSGRNKMLILWTGVLYPPPLFPSLQETFFAPQLWQFYVGTAATTPTRLLSATRWIARRDAQGPRCPLEK
jgi:hypothetical protein